MKSYEIPLSPITESCRQILFQVAIAVLDHVHPPYLCTRKQACGVCRGCEGIIPLKQEYTGSETGGGSSAEHIYKSNR